MLCTLAVNSFAQTANVKTIPNAANANPRYMILNESATTSENHINSIYARRGGGGGKGLLIGGIIVDVVGIGLVGTGLSLRSNGQKTIDTYNTYGYSGGSNEVTGAAEKH
jgi:hypothetical protein